MPMPETIIQVQPAQQTTLNINSSPTSGLYIGIVGPAGPQGMQGPQGEQGPQGAAGTGSITAAVTKIIAGTNITITPSSGTGDVTVNSSGGSTDLSGLNAATAMLSSKVNSLDSATGVLNSKDTALASGTALNASQIASLESATAAFNTHLTGTDSGTGSNLARILTLETVTGTLNSKDSALASGTAANASKISSLESATSSINSHLTGTDSGTGSLQTQVGSLWNAKVPYTGASANVNITTYGLTAGSISSGGGITGTTVSASVLLAGNFMAITAALDAKDVALAAGTGSNASRLTGVESGTGNLQTQVGSLWNSKVPYTGASANVNITTYGLTAGSISSGGGITGTTVSASVLLAGNYMVTTASFNSRLSGLESGTGNLQTQVGSLWNSKVPYTGATANLNLAAYALTAASVSSASITSTGAISGSTLSAGSARLAKLFFGDGGSLTTTVFSRGATLASSGGVIVGNYTIWRAPFNCTVSAVWARFVGAAGVSASMNARNGTANVLTSPILMGVTNSWSGGTTLQNTGFTAGSTLDVTLTAVTGVPTQITIQVDFTR
jgi:hypothetical protein